MIRADAIGDLDEALPDLHAEDLLVVIRAATEKAADEALGSLEELLTVRTSTADAEARSRTRARRA